MVSDGRSLDRARALVEDELAAIDAACSRFREDSELVRLNRGEGPVRVSSVLLAAVECALRAAAATGGVVDPTVGAAMDAIGYDRDFEAIAADGPPVEAVPAGGWARVRLDRPARTVELPSGVQLDLGATAKAWAADRAASRVGAALGRRATALVSLGGDIAVAGAPPRGWPVAIGDDHASPTGRVTVAISGGGLATSSTTVRRWKRAGRVLHHIVDPATGLPPVTPWRSATVAAGSCVDANAASTAAIVLGHSATAWLDAAGLPALLVAESGDVTTVGDWPAAAMHAA